MPSKHSQRGPSDFMNQPDMDQLMNDIQSFLRAETGSELEIDPESVKTERRAAGIFLPTKNPETMAMIARLALRTSYAVEGLTILGLIGALALTWPSWLHLGLTLAGILGAGLVGSLLLLGVYARINLLLDIESNTRRIAANKEKIATLLQRVWIV